MIDINTVLATEDAFILFVISIFLESTVVNGARLEFSQNIMLEDVRHLGQILEFPSRLVNFVSIAVPYINIYLVTFGDLSGDNALHNNLVTTFLVFGITIG